MKLSLYGIHRPAYKHARKLLIFRGQKEPGPLQVIRKIFDFAIDRNEKDYHKLSMVYFQKALFLDEEGEDAFSALQGHFKMQLFDYKEKGAKRVKIIIIDEKLACEACLQLDGIEFSIEEALERMPIPVKQCPFCMCRYIGADYKNIR